MNINLFTTVLLFLRAVESIRQQKISSLLKKELGHIFQRYSKDHFKGAFITVTVVRISQDLSYARVYLSFLAVKDKKALLEYIGGQKKMVRGLLSKSIGKNMRKVPDLSFYLDDSGEYAQEIDQLLKGPNKGQ
ncbi:MAG: 30S ribosome-binding factor RbfA [Bacteroidota bacterium]